MDPLVGVNCSQIDFTNRSCFEFSETGFKAVVWCRTGFSILGALTSAVAILYFVSIACSKGPVARLGNKIGVKPAARLALYLCIASLFNGIITAIQIVPVSGRLTCDHVVANNFCAAASFLIQYSVWTILLLMVWIYVEIIMAVLTDNEENEHSRCCIHYIKYRDSKYYDGCVLATTLLVPNIFCIIPLTKPKVYGLAGAWCWIKARDDECQEVVAGVVEQFVLWYAWVMVFVVVFVVTVIFVWRKIYKTKQYARDDHQSHYRRYLKDIRPLIIYPIVFSVIYGLGFANRIIYGIHEETILWLWIPHGIADALVSLMIPLFFLLHHRKKINDQLSVERWPLLDDKLITESAT